MPVLKNIRHERFAREYVKTGVGAEAYRRVYPRAHPISTARINACKLLTSANIARRTMEIRQAMLKRSDITMEKILADYQNAMTRDDAKPSDVIAAATAQAKLVGLLRDRIEAGNVGDFDNVDSISDIIATVRDQVGEQAAMALITAFGLNKTIDNQADNDKLAAAPAGSDSVN